MTKTLICSALTKTKNKNKPTKQKREKKNKKKQSKSTWWSPQIHSLPYYHKTLHIYIYIYIYIYVCVCVYIMRYIGCIFAFNSILPRTLSKGQSQEVVEDPRTSSIHPHPINSRERMLRISF